MGLDPVKILKAAFTKELHIDLGKNPISVRLVLEKDHLVDASSITVSTRNWVATLGGTASSEVQRNAAEDDAWYLWGINEVLNNIRVT